MHFSKVLFCIREFILFGCSQNVIVNVWQGGLSWGQVDPRGFVPLLINWFFHQISFFSHHSRKSHFLNSIDIWETEYIRIQILDPDIWESFRDIFAHFLIINESEGRYFYLEFRWQILFLMRGNNKSENKKVLNLQVSVLMRHSFQHICLKQCGFCPSSAFLQLQNWMFYCVINNWHMWVSFVPSESASVF